MADAEAPNVSDGKTRKTEGGKPVQRDGQHIHLHSTECTEDNYKRQTLF